MLQLLPHLVNGVSLGLLFALIALGFMLIVGVMETINLAHGSLFALGMYVALFLVDAAAGLVSRAAGGLRRAAARHPLRASRCCSRRSLVGVFGMLLELCMRRTYGKDPLYGLLLTFGAALVIEEAIRVVWGSTEKQLPLPEAISGAFLLGDLIYSRYRFFAARLRLPDDRPALALPREDAVRRDHQGRRARQRDGAGARHQPVAAAALRVRARRRRWRRSPAW